MIIRLTNTRLALQKQKFNFEFNLYRQNGQRQLYHCYDKKLRYLSMCTVLLVLYQFIPLKIVEK